MDHFLKKTIIVVFVILSCLSFSSCFFKDHVFSWDVRHDAEAWFECIKNKDAEALMEYFSPYIKENRREETITELNSIFAFIEGNIVSYKYSSGSLMEKMDHGHIYYYDCHPHFENVQTERKNNLEIVFHCHLIYDERPEHQGLEEVVVRSNDGRGNIIRRISAGEYFQEEMQ